MRKPVNHRDRSRASDHGAKALWIGALAMLVGACGEAAVPAPAKGPLPSTPGATTAMPSAAPLAQETPDAAFRYVPPDLGDPVAPALTAEDVTLANGLTGRIVASRTSPIAGAYLTVRWKTAPKIPGSGAALGGSLDRMKTASGRTLGDELRDLGASWSWFVTQDGIQIRIVALPSLLEPALALMLATLRSGKIDKGILDTTRERVQKDIAAETDIVKAQRRVDAHLFGASHRYHDAANGTAESLKKLAPADVMRFRDDALGPDGVTIAFAGALTKGEVAAVLERVAGGWKAAAKGKAAAPVEAARGVFLVDEPGGEQAHVVVTMPILTPGRADFEASLVAAPVFVGRCFTHLRAVAPASEWQGIDRFRPRAEGRMLEWIVDAPAGSAATVVEAALRAMEDFTNGTLLDRELLTARRKIVRRVLAVDGIDAQLFATAEELLNGAPPGALIGLYATAPVVPREDVIRAGTALFRKDRAIVVAWGPVAKEKAAFEKLGLGKVIIENAPKSAPAKSGGKP